MSLQRLNDDTLIHIFSFLPVLAILTLRQTCRRLATISRLRFVWQTACVDQVLLEEYPFPNRLLVTASAIELERLVLRALALGALWLAPSALLSPRFLEFQAATGSGVSHVYFLPKYRGRYIVTVYKGIWSMVSCWDLGGDLSPGTIKSNPRRVTDWSPRNSIFSGFVVNCDPESDGALAVSVQHGSGTQSIEILSISDEDGAPSSFRSICNIATTFRPITLKGDLIAFSDNASETVIMNWRKNTFALLKGSQRPVDERFQYNRCLHVVFAYESILVVRARSVELFLEPELRSLDVECAVLHPIGFYTFGWIDGVSVNAQSGSHVNPRNSSPSSKHQPLTILLRAESDDPWASDTHRLEQFVLLPNPAFHSPPTLASTPSAIGPDASAGAEVAHCPVPYIFPPVRAEHTSPTVPTVRGFLRCKHIVLGPSGTALWIQPRAAHTAHLTGLDVHSSITQIADGLDPNYQHPDDVPLTLRDPRRAASRTRAAETLCAAVFAGPLQRRHPEVQTRARSLWVQQKDNCTWTAFDYDEETGKVVLGSSDGSVTVLDLV